MRYTVRIHLFEAERRLVATGVAASERVAAMRAVDNLYSHAKELSGRPLIFTTTKERRA